MPNDTVLTTQIPIWSINPNDTDWLAWTAIVAIGLAIYFIMFLYAAFDHWVESRAKGTILAKTIPTLLGVALLYEIFPLAHFSILLPLSAILIAMMADWMAMQARHEHVAVDYVNDDGIEPEKKRKTKKERKTTQKSIAVDKRDTESIKRKTEEITNV